MAEAICSLPFLPTVTLIFDLLTSKLFFQLLLTWEVTSALSMNVVCVVFSQPSIYIDGWLYAMSVTLRCL